MKKIGLHWKTDINVFVEMAAAIPPSDTNVCFAELIVRLDSLLTLRDNQEDVEQNDEEIEDLIEAKMNLKLI